MKRIIFLAFLIPLFLVSCHKHEDLIPVAKFSADTDNPVVGQDVYFYNESHNGVTYKWDFGDGFISNDKEPIHYFAANGVYNVTLTVVSGSGLESVAALDINVVIPTLLEIEVREYYDDYAVPDASVLLYESITDWDNQANSVAEGFTDQDGFVVFAGLGSYPYYVDVWEQNHDNYTLRQEDYQTFIRTPDVLPNKINRFIAWVDYVEHTKGALKGTRTARIVKMERKLPARNQPEASSDTTGWQELYKKAIKIKK